MEFGHMPPTFGMGIVDSASEVIRIQQQAAEHALAQMQMQAQRDAMQPPQPAEQAQRSQTSATADPSQSQTVGLLREQVDGAGLRLPMDGGASPAALSEPVPPKRYRGS
jgi:hypothetical protein